MSDNYIKVTVTGNKSKSVSVKSTELKNQITAGADMSIYYSNKAKEWAISDKLVDNEDYSSKYHANLAKSYAEEGALQIAEITTLRELTLADIETEKQNVIDVGTDQINQVTTISNTAISDIEISKTNALSDIDSAKTIVLEDISTQESQTLNNIRETADVELDKIVGVGIDSRANIDLSNLSEAGEKHFINKSQITNCITEIPQRIKADVTDGTLTVYAGTVAIVPYGTTDRTSEFPVGSTFIHENFKVVDTQFETSGDASGKFFVWVELQGNIQVATTISDSSERLVEIELKGNSVRSVINTISSATQYSGTSNCVNYRTDLNLIQYSASGTLDADDVISLPILRVKADGTYVYGSITQTFNGFGYIGSTIWADKGIKGLVANGRNADRTLKNIEAHTENLLLLTNTTSSYGARYYAFRQPKNGVWKEIGFMAHQSFDVGEWVYNELDNAFIYNGVVQLFCPFANATNEITSPFQITSFNPKQPFRAVDYNDLETKVNEIESNLDGNWVAVNKEIFTGKSFAKNAYSTYNANDILPKDGHVYDCIFRCYWEASDSGNSMHIQGYNSIPLVFGKTAYYGDATGLVPVKSGGTYKVGNLSSSKQDLWGVGLRLVAYRKAR